MSRIPMRLPGVSALARVPEALVGDYKSRGWQVASKPKKADKPEKDEKADKAETSGASEKKPKSGKKPADGKTK